MKTALFAGAAFVIFFLSLFSSIIALLSLVSGWRRLSATSPAPGTSEPGAPVYRFQNLVLGVVRYNRCVDITFTSAGIIFSPMWPFSFMHRPFIIRYDRISNIRNGSFLGPYVAFKAEGKNIQIRGKSTIQLEKRINIQLQDGSGK